MIVRVALLGLLAVPAFAQESKPAPAPAGRVGADAQGEAKLQAETAQAGPKLGVLIAGDVRAVGGLTLIQRAQQPGAPFRLSVLRDTTNGHVAKVPPAAKALDDAAQALERARTASDADAALKALDDIEREVMRARAALQQARDQEKAKPAGNEQHGK